MRKSSKKQRANSYEAGLSDEELQLLHTLCLERSLSLVDMQRAAPSHKGGALDGKQPSLDTISKIATRLRTEQVMVEIDAAEKIMEAARQKAKALPPAEREQTLDAICDLIGNEVIQKTVAGLDAKNRTAAARLLLKRADQKRFDQKFKQQLKSDLEKGLDALYETIKGVPEAVTAFEELKAVVSKATA